MPRAHANRVVCFVPWLCCLGFACAALALAGCGGGSSGGNGGGGGTQKATPTISAWPTASAIIYGQTLAASTLTGGTASTSGTFAWTTPSTAPSAGVPSESVTFTPSDATDYNTVAGSVAVTVGKATPTVSAWPTASAITYGQSLASSTLTGGTASAPGTFAWTTPSTAPTAGTHSESITFTPTDTTDYNGAPGSVTVTVYPATPKITWATPAAITYGTALSSTQLDATASVGGAFAYAPASGAVLGAGTQTLNVSFAPTDAADYATASTSTQLVVNKATPAVSSWPTASAITYGQELASSTLTGGVASTPGTFAWTTLGTVPATGTDSESVTFTPTDIADYNAAIGSVDVTVNPVTPTITSVSLPCTTTSITNVQTTTCTPQVAGTGAFTNTVNLTLTPASAGTLSASANVASGTPVVFTPTFNTGAQTPTITATSTEDPTKSSGAVEITVTLRTITINSPTGNIWLADCSQLFFYSVAQTGIVSGDTLYINPYQPSTFTSTPGSTFTVSLGIGNSPSGPNPCSPGAYDEYVTGTDGARSNDVYIPILSPFNMWAGYNSTDEFQVDFAGNTICKYKLTDGTPDGCVPENYVALAAIVDGNNVLVSNLGSGGITVINATTGTSAGGIGPPSDGSTIVAFAAKNGIAGYTTTKPEVGFSIESFNTVNTLPNVGTAPSVIAGSTGCNANLNAASFFSYDNAGSTLYRSDVVGNVASGTVTSKSVVSQVTLSGLSPASALPANLARYVVAWDSSCKAAVLAPVVTGGTNPDGTTAYLMAFALVDMTSGNAHQIGTYVSTGIPSTAIRMAADPSGNDVVIASTNQAAGTTVLTEVSWTLDANENPTFAVSALGSSPPVGVYGVSLGILPSSAVPNGNVLRVGQRQQHYALPNQ